MKTHHLKTWPSFYRAVLDGSKTFEIRGNDRDFAVGDTLVLEEWDPTTNLHLPKGYTGRKLEVRVAYLVQGAFGLPPALCVMAITLLQKVSP